MITKYIIKQNNNGNIISLEFNSLVKAVIKFNNIVTDFISKNKIKINDIYSRYFYYKNNGNVFEVTLETSINL